MSILQSILIIVEVVVCLLLTGLILIQKAKGGGLGTAFGAGAGESLLGSRAGNVLTRGTIILASVFLLNTLVLAMIITGRHEKTLMDAYTIAPSGPQVQEQQAAQQNQQAQPQQTVPNPLTEQQPANPAVELPPQNPDPMQVPPVMPDEDNP